MKRTIALMLAMLLAAAVCGCAPAQPVQQEPVQEPEPVQTEPVQEPEPAQPEPAEEPVQPEPAQTESASKLEGVYGAMLEVGVLPEMMEVKEALVADFYGIEAAQYTDAVFYISYDNLLADEVVLITAASEADAEAIEQLLNSRLDAKRQEADGYSPEQSAIIKACSVLRDGLELALIVSPEAEALTDAYRAGMAS